jgi:DNA-binding NarL/FixJ family response regulator
MLADDHKIMRQGLRKLLEAIPDIEIVDEADNGREVVKIAVELSPNIVIMDVAMPDLNGIEATKQIISQVPRIKVISLSMHSDKRFVIGMLKAGASGYCLKHQAFDELNAAIRAVAANHYYLSPTIFDKVIKDYTKIIDKYDSSGFSILSGREREVLQLFAEGKTTKEIASVLTLSVKTIETYRQQIMDKLHADNMADVIKYAIREGITSLEELPQE